MISPKQISFSTPEKTFTCPSCDGTGTDLYDSTEHYCQICNGVGKVSEEKLKEIKE